MIGRIKELLLGSAKKDRRSGGRDRTDYEYRAKVAVCALLLEIANFDDDFHENERKVIMDLVRSKFGLEGGEADEFLDLAQKERKESIDLWQFTKIINRTFDKKGKIHLLEMLWEVVYADGHLHGHEDFLIHKIATLLKLEHKDLIGAKISVKNNL